MRRRCVAVVVGVALALSACGQPDTGNVASGGPAFVEPSGTAPVVAEPSVAPADTPSATPSKSAPVKASASPSASATVKAAKVTYTFPVVGNTGYGHTHHDYPATDIITNCGNPVLAATSGVVLEVKAKDLYKASVNAGATRGGLSVSILGDDGVRYYGSHLSRIQSGITTGVRVKSGQRIGTTGDTGDASACHLHFGISPPCAQVGDWYTQRGTIYPWPYLDAWKKHVSKSPVAAVAAWKSEHGCPKRALVDP